jgi:hypothetical protein
MGDKIKDVLRNYVGYLSVALLCSAYVATAFVQIEESGKTVGRIIADGMLYFILGILINRIFDSQGLMTGSRDERVLKTTKLHNDIVDRIYPLMDKLEDWCDMKNSEALKKARKAYLSRMGMRYADYFDEDGIAKEFDFKENLTSRRARWHEWRRYRHFRHAVKIRLTQISAGLLISDAGQADDPYFMGRSKPEYIKASTKKDIVMKSLTSVLFGYYGVSLITDFSVANLIWTVLQVGIFVAMGTFSMQSSIIYVTDEYRGRIIKKIDCLQQFEVSINKEEQKNGAEQKENPLGLLQGGDGEPDTGNDPRECEAVESALRECASGT